MSLPSSALPFLGVACGKPNSMGAGPAHGPLRVRSPAAGGLWFGSPEMYPSVRVKAFFPDGTTASSSSRVLLHPGFG